MSLTGGKDWLTEEADLEKHTAGKACTQDGCAKAQRQKPSLEV